MADGPESTVKVNADTSKAKQEVKSLAQTFGGFFGEISAASSLGGSALSSFFKTAKSASGDLRVGFSSLSDSSLTLRERFAMMGMGAKDAFVTIGKGGAGLKSEFSTIGSLLGDTVLTPLKAIGPAVATAGLAIAGVAAAVVGALTVIGGAVAGAGLGIYKLVSSFADAGDEVFTLSQKTGIGAEALTAMQYVAEQTGASFDGITNSIFKMGINVETGSKKTVSALKAIGLSTKELKDLKPEEQFSKILAGMQSIPEGAQRAVIGTQIFGKGFRDIAQLVNEDLDGLIANAKTFGLVMSDEMAAAGDQFGDTLSDIGSIFTGLRNIIGAGLLPIMNAFIGTVRDELVVVFGMVKTVLRPVIDLFGGVRTGLLEGAKSAEFHTTVLRALVGVIAFVMSALSALLKGVAYVTDEWYKLRIALNTIHLVFMTVVEGFLWGAQKIAQGFAKISFGETRKSFERDANQLGESLSNVQEDLRKTGEEILAYQNRKESMGASVLRVSDALSQSATELRTMAANYKGTASAADDVSKKTVKLSEDLDLTGDSAKGAANDIAQLGEKVKSLSDKLSISEKAGAPLSAFLAQFGSDIRKTVEEADLFGVSVPDNLRKAAEAAVEFEAGKKLAELSVNLDKARIAGTPLAEVMSQFGAEIKKAVDEADAFGREVPENVRAAHDAIIEAKFAEAYESAMKDVREINAKEWDAIAKETETKVKEAGKAYDGMKDVVTKAQDEAFLATKKGLARQLAELDIKQREEIKKLGTIPATYAKVYDAASANIETKYRDMARNRDVAMAKEIADLAKIGPTYGASYEKAKAAVQEKYRVMAALAEKRLIEEIAGLGPIPEAYRKTYDEAVNIVNESFSKMGGEAVIADQKAKAKAVKDAWLSALGELASAFDQLANITGGGDTGFSGVVKFLGQTVGAMNLAGKAGKTMADGWAEATKEGGSLVAGAAGIATGLIGAVGAMQSATDHAEKSKQVIGGMAAGMQLGMQVAGPWGAAVGAGIGAIWGALRGKPDWAKIQDDIKKEFGFAVSQQLAKEIEALGKTIEGGTKEQRRKASETLSLSKIIAEAGGLTDANVATYQKRALALFDPFIMNGNKAGDAVKELNSVVSMFADRLAKTGGIADKTFLAIIDKAKASGKEIAAVNQFLEQQGQQIVGGIKAFLDNATIGSQASAEALAGSVMGVWDELKRQGKSTSEIVKAIGPIVQDLEKQFAATGFTGGEAFESIRNLIATASDEIVSKGVTAVAGLTQTIVGLANTNRLTEPTFAALTAEVARTRDGLIAQGKSSADVTTLMAGDLQKIWELQQRNGYAVDEVTQKMLDEAVASGEVGAQHMSAADKMVAATDRVASAVEFMAMKMGFVPKAADGMAAGVENASRRMRGAVGGVTDEVEGASGAVNEWADNWVRKARDVQDEIDAISFGHSPGGIKEFKPMLRDAVGAFEHFATKGVRDIKSLQREVDAFGGLNMNPDLKTSFTATEGPAETIIRNMNANADTQAQATAAQGPAQIIIQPGAIVVDRPILKDRDSMQELTSEVARQLRETLGQFGLWTRG